VVTGSRSDYGIYLPLLRKIQADPELRLHLIATGMHLSPEFGLTYRGFEADGLEIGDHVEMLLSSDSPEGIAKSMGLGTIGFAQSFGSFRPDILLVLGDRFEMHAAALAAIPFKIPLAHIHGGEVTQGAMDDALRHAITKLSHLHFVTTEEYARRVIQLGEEPWRVILSSAPSLDNLDTVKLLTTAELESLYGFSLDPSPLLVTFHPVTLEYERAEWQLGELLAALDVSGRPVIFTMPNADTKGRLLVNMIVEYVQARKSAHLVHNFGTKGYFSMMSHAAAMVGNSSSGLIEAPSFRLPVVNIGTRQDGRVRVGHVIDVGYDRKAISEGIRKALQPEFSEKLKKLANPYYHGNASEAIVQRLKKVSIDGELIKKRFHDLDVPGKKLMPGKNDEMA
jgi:UDP-hydrolysing UDP-N-acetyl-D-glucosamine 2-epimerase